MKKVCCQLSPSSHTPERVFVYELSSCQKRKSSREMENERIRILLERQKEQILAEVRTEIHKHEFRADSDRSIQELNGLIEFSEGRLIILLQVMNNSDVINYCFKNNYWNKIGIFVKLISKVFMGWKN